MKTMSDQTKTMYQGGRNLALTKLGIDPIEMGGLLAMGKIMTTNALNRWGMHFPPIRRIGQEIAGVGLRTAQQGKPMLSAPLRNIAAVAGDPKLVGLYETAHNIGSRIKGVVGASTPLHEHHAQLNALEHAVPDSKEFAAFVRGIPTQSTGIRKAIDYGFTPVSQVGTDIRNQGRRMITRARNRFTPT